MSYADQIRVEPNAYNMRELIADGIEENKSIADTANSNSSNALNTANNANNRVDNIVANQGSAESTEVIDSRHDNVNNISYQNLGSRLDSHSLRIKDMSTYSARGLGLILGDNTTGNTTTLSNLISNVGNANLSISFGGGIYFFDDNLTIPKNIILKIDKGTKFIVADTKTLIINAEIKAGRYQIFDYTSTNTDITKSNIIFTELRELYPEWFGAIPNDPTVDCRIGLKRLYASCASTTDIFYTINTVGKGAVIDFDCGRYFITNEIDPPAGTWCFKGIGQNFIDSNDDWKDTLSTNYNNSTSTCLKTIGFTEISFNAIKNNMHILETYTANSWQNYSLLIENITFNGLDVASSTNPTPAMNQNNIGISFIDNTNSVDGLIINYARSIIRNVCFIGISGTALTINTVWNKIYNPVINKCGNGIAVMSTDNNIYNPQINRVKTGITIGTTTIPANWCKVYNCRIEWCTEHAVKIINSGSVTVTGDVDACNFSGINAQYCGSLKLDLTIHRCGQYKAYLTFNQSDFNTLEDYIKGSNIYMYSCSDVRIDTADFRSKIRDSDTDFMSPAYNIILNDITGYSINKPLADTEGRDVYQYHFSPHGNIMIDNKLFLTYGGYFSSLSFSTEPPTSGTHYAGEIVFNMAATPVGWKCTTPGTPGTWTAF
ncbi:hypothetical protein KYB31_09095 [Clostridium felsineum]|uniref:hypothetical protein n=1 Tax=Clostridium felsineum TaxID=36839 RepID=UPI00214D50DA|nr:hypothetical protein [Clostridium felsineum]MCR3759144.1 hypothetical protein [Clostridium felsineum]